MNDAGVRAPAAAPGSSASADLIETAPRPACPICGGDGTLRHESLTDTLFAVPGTWRMRVCASAACGAAWLDPAPTEASIGQAYVRYYTHEAGAGERGGAVAALLHAWWRVTGLAAERAALGRMALDGVAPGRLLDVGCGDGRRFAALEARGWRVEGQEINPSAAAAARAAGHTVHLGPLSSLPAAAGPFDAVTLNHVIEHVHDPVGLLRECRRLLRPGGTLIAITPNAASTGHRRFEPAWRGLEPPRHLTVFAPPALARVAREAGFAQVDVRTSAANAYTLGAASLAAAAHRAGVPLGFVAGRVGALRFQTAASRAFRADPDSGEECVLTAVTS